jgi:hypothetical protein
MGNKQGQSFSYLLIFPILSYHLIAIFGLGYGKLEVSLF